MFHCLDTLATVTIDGVVRAETENMHRTIIVFLCLQRIFLRGIDLSGAISSGRTSSQFAYRERP